MYREDPEARVERLRREDAEFAEEAKGLSPAEIRSELFRFGMGAVFALVVITIGTMILRVI
ncbi:hypothetical protein BK673_12895 [Pseudomonas fluorescens]|jgi:hypothetical protein|uniref:Uncharacterized protein n=1 Tax=Pseudomonas fluorescens TaxID=294 RepID=A0A423P6A3_PSEFL|nr:hypothetical protein BOW65_16870 [Pseudomonas koreensis]ROO09798.1 hypothetical protein BK673_12895 [Pseudomonas fluorescens]TKJ86430.1 hypothetical protein PkoCFBP13504_06985 [Pseudomonas koreensis]